MNLKNFISEVEQFTRNKLGEEYDIRINEVPKNNGLRLHGISIMKKGECIAPNIYLEGYYEQHLNGMSVEAVYDDIWNTYKTTNVKDGMDFLQQKITMESRCNDIIFRLVNYEKNRKQLENMPHLRFLDLAITFHCLVNLDEGGISTLPITNVIKEHWQTDESTLMRYALENSENLLKMKVRPIEEVMMDLFEASMERMMSHPEEASEETVDYYDEMRVTLEEMQTGDDVDMYVMTNEIGINGASVLLYQNSFLNFAKKIGSDLYILPSSVHELILVPVNDNISPEQLIRMVGEVNTTQVPYEDILSNHVYIFKLKSSSFEIV